MFLLQRQSLALIALSVLTGACAQNKSEDVLANHKASSSLHSGSVVPGAPVPTLPPVPPPPPALPTAAPLSFLISGKGNHPEHVCVPSTAILKLRVRAIGQAITRSFPLSTPVATTTYGALRMRFSVQGISEAQFTINSKVGAWSSTTDFSSYVGRGQVPSCTYPNLCMFFPTLPTPEYKGTIYGADRYDGLCTFWESEFRGCGVTSELVASYTAECAPGEQKILIDEIKSDNPCGALNPSPTPPSSWCDPGQKLQYALDTEEWNIEIQAITEATRQTFE